MTTSELTSRGRRVCTRWWPELAIAALATSVFLGFLGSPELWGKREQRAAAEALDTIENHRWLVAQIQSRPRLEKPPLPRWIIASLMGLTGRRDEGIVRLPSALLGLGCVALVYALGSAIGGRGVGLSSAIFLSTCGLFVAELRQAGNDGPLAFFTTLANFAAWKILHGKTWGRQLQVASVPTPRRWVWIFHAALGLGFLSKGPVILLLTGLTIVPYLVMAGSFRSGLGRLADPRGLLLFLALVLCWPVPVLLLDPNALGVWMLEIGQKTGLLAIVHRQRSILGLSLPIMALPWSVLGLAGLTVPFLGHRGVPLPWRNQAVWFPWWWVVGNLAVFSCWAVAKPNYFVPCLPGLALLMGLAWIALCQWSRLSPSHTTRSRAQRWILGQLGLIAASGLIAPILGRSYLPTANVVWLTTISASVVFGAAWSACAWRRGSAVQGIVPIAAALALATLIGYGAIAPSANPARGHRGLARQLQQLIPDSIRTLRYFHEIDEGLWFYLRRPNLAPIPGTQPQYNAAYDRVRELARLGLPYDGSGEPVGRRMEREIQHLREWLRYTPREEPLFLMRGAVFDRHAPELTGLATLILREDSLRRNGLVLLSKQAASDTPKVLPPIATPLSPQVAVAPRERAELPPSGALPTAQTPIEPIGDPRPVPTAGIPRPSSLSGSAKGCR